MSKILDEKDIELTQRFFDYELSEKELDNFHQRMETDTDFKIGVERFQKSSLMVDLLEGESEMPTIQATYTKETSKSKGKMFLLLFLIVAGMLAAGMYFWSQSNNQEPTERVYASVEKYVTNMSNNVTRGENIDEPSPLSPIQLLIKEIKELDSAPGEPIVELNGLLNNTLDNNSKEVIYWWLVKSYLKTGDRQSAKETLTKIIDIPDFNSAKKAKEILEEL